LTWGKKKLLDRETTHALIEGTFDTLKIWKWQREKDEHMIKTIKGNALKKENCNQSSI